MKVKNFDNIAPAFIQYNFYDIALCEYLLYKDVLKIVEYYFKNYFFDKITIKQAEAFALKYGGSLTQKEIAERVYSSQPTISRHITKAEEIAFNDIKLILECISLWSQLKK